MNLLHIPTTNLFRNHFIISIPTHTTSRQSVVSSGLNMYMHFDYSYTCYNPVHLISLTILTAVFDKQWSCSSFLPDMQASGNLTVKFYIAFTSASCNSPIPQICIECGNNGPAPVALLCIVAPGALRTYLLSGAESSFKR
jgi:hypothetical protein